MKYYNLFYILYFAFCCLQSFAMEDDNSSYFDNSQDDSTQKFVEIGKFVVKEHSQRLHTILNGLLKITEIINTCKLPQGHEGYYQDLKKLYPALKQVYQEQPLEIYNSIDALHQVLTLSHNNLKILTTYGLFPDTLFNQHKEHLDNLSKLKNDIQPLCQFFDYEQDQQAVKEKTKLVQSFFN